LLEFFLLNIAGYNSKLIGDSTCFKHNHELNFSYYKKNCEYSEKHWESKETINYFFNEYGRRDGKSFKNMPKVAFLGDSFTAGLMVNINDNYNYYAFNNLIKKKYTVHNYGVAGEQADNIFNKLRHTNFNEYKHIIYGLTPNDFFDYLEYQSAENKIENKALTKTPILKVDNNYNLYFNFINYLKQILLKTATSKFLLHSFMSIDNIYIKIYSSRKPYSEYLNSNLNSKWIKALDKFDSNLSTLPLKIKNKLSIFLLPQRGEVVSNRLNKYSNTFKSRVQKICEKNQIKFYYANIDELSKLKSSHFAVDGHLTREGNHIVAIDLSDWINAWGN